MSLEFLPGSHIGTILDEDKRDLGVTMKRGQVEGRVGVLVLVVHGRVITNHHLTDHAVIQNNQHWKYATFSLEGVLLFFVNSKELENHAIFFHPSLLASNVYRVSRNSILRSKLL